MENKYLFRGKRINNIEWIPVNNEWLQGYLYGIRKRKFILWGTNNGIPNMIEVDPSTICRCVGYEDKNGKLIWEHDIVHVKYTDGQENYQEIVEVTCSKHGFVPYSWEYECDGCDSRCEILEIEVIGDKFNNPELLENGGVIKMMENEAIKELETSINLARMCTQNYERKREIQSYEMAIKALEEVQKYRAIGTPEECKKAMEKQNA